MRLKLFLPVLLLLAACGQGNDADKSDVVGKPRGTAPAASSPPVDKPVAPVDPEHPTLRIATFDGQTFDLAKHRGHWVVVNFWATWCVPCLKEMPALSAFDAERDDVEVVGLAYEDIEVADMKAFLEQHPVHYPIAIVDVYNPPAAFGTPRGLPMTFLVAPDGKLASKFLGPVSAEDLKKAIAAASTSGQ